MRIILIVVIVAIGSIAIGDEYVRGYTKRNGTYVAPYERTSPNSTVNDNFSTRGNANPYTGVQGTKPRDQEYKNPYGSMSND